MRNRVESDVSGAGITPVELGLDNRKSYEIKRDWSEPGALSKEWEVQSRNLAHLLAGKLGLQNDEYSQSLSYFDPQPESFKNIDAPTFPLLVDPRVSLRDLLKLEAAGRNRRNIRPDHIEIEIDNREINSSFDLRKVRDWTGGDFRKPKEPYSTWVIYVPDASIEEIRKNLFDDQRGGTVLDGIMFYYKHPDILNKYSLKFPGSQVGAEYAPFISASPNSEPRGRPNHPSLNRGSIDTSSPKSACLIASKI